MIAQQKISSEEPTVPRRSWNHRFRVGDEVRTVGGGGPYDRGRIVEVAEKERYYRVDYGLGYASTIREENLEPFDEGDHLSEPPKSFVSPIPPLVYALLAVKLDEQGDG